MSTKHCRNVWGLLPLVLMVSVLLQDCKLEEIPPLPSVEFTVLCGTITDGGDSCLMVFTNSSINGDSYLWNFGDGTTSTSRIPESKKMLNNCSYAITLKVTNQTGSSQHTQGITLGTAIPVASFSTQGFPIAACDGTQLDCNGEPFNTTVAFINESTCAYRYQWTIENDGGFNDVLDDFEPMYEWCDSAVYSVTLVAYGQDEFGNEIASEEFTSQVQVYGTSVTTCTTADFDSPHICETQGVGCTMPLTNNSSNAESYLWQVYRSDNPGVLYDSSEEESPSIFFEGNSATQVDYDVYLTAFGIFNDDVASERIHVLPDGETAAIFHTSQTVCNAPCTIDIEEYSVNALSWNWLINDEQFATGPLPVDWDTTFYAPGIYNFTLQVTGLGEETINWTISEAVNVLPFDSSEWVCGEVWIDSRDNHPYNTVDINGVCFMAENLDFEMDSSYVGTGGFDQCPLDLRYYSWEDAQEASLVGWHILTEVDLQNALGDLSNPNPSVIELGDGGMSGFNAIGGGTYNNPNCGQGDPNYWIAFNEEGAVLWLVGPEIEMIFGNITSWLNVRCVKD